MHDWDKYWLGLIVTFKVWNSFNLMATGIYLLADLFGLVAFKIWSSYDLVATRVYLLIDLFGLSSIWEFSFELRKTYFDFCKGNRLQMSLKKCLLLFISLNFLLFTFYTNEQFSYFLPSHLITISRKFS